MGAIRPSSPSTTGQAPKMQKMFDGRNIATRPIPVITDYGDVLAVRAAAADAKPKLDAVNMPSGPRPQGLEQVFGTQVNSPADVVAANVWNPSVGVQQIP